DRHPGRAPEDLEVDPVQGSGVLREEFPRDDVGPEVFDRLQIPVRRPLGEADEEENRHRKKEEDPQREPGRQDQRISGPVGPIPGVAPHEGDSGGITTAYSGFQQRNAGLPVPNRASSSNGFTFCSYTTNRSSASSRTIQSVDRP